jgi:putative SbcD/Mre11-related phosphoesterase
MIAWDDWLLTPERVAIHRPTATAVVSDLHLGYAEARRRGGESIPAPSVEEVLLPLKSLLRSCEIHDLVIAGDLFEAGPNTAVIERLLDWLAGSGVKSVRIIPGNHDRGLRTLPAELKPVEEPVSLGCWQIVHGDKELPSGSVVQGHIHPGLRIGRGLSPLPCFLARPGHLVLPAYSLEASGGDVHSQRRWQGYRCLAIAGNDIVDLGERATRARSASKG